MQEFMDFIIENNVFGFYEQPIRLRSGRISPYYVNWRTVCEDAYLIDKLSDFVIDFVATKGLRPTCFFGVPEGATKLGIITQYKWVKNKKDFKPGAYPLPMGRGKTKKHGDPKDRYFLGIPRGKTVVIEDVVTTGNSLISTLEKLLGMDIEVKAALVLTDRNEKRNDEKSVEEAVESLGVKYFAMSNAADVLPIICERKRVGERTLRAIEDYFKKYGVTKIEFG